jgi:hypothetical protein
MRTPFLFLILVSSVSVAESSLLPGMQRSRIRLIDVEQPAGSGCSKDSDCKGDRICTAAVCQTPPYSAPPVAPSMGPSLLGNAECGGVISKLINLQQRIELLELSRPSMAWPIFLTIFGGVGFFSGGVAMAVLSYAIWFGAIIAGIAAIPLTIGIIFWIINGNQNARIDRQIDQLKSERAAMGMSSHLVNPNALNQGELATLFQF